MTQKELFTSTDDDRPGDGHQGDAASLPKSDSAGTDFACVLRARREERGLSLDECGQALRLPVRVLRQLETGDYTGIDYQVYLRGYLLKYGHYLGVAEADIQTELQRLTPRQPTLVSTGGISRSRYLLEHYAQAASYIVLTVVILVPVVWFGLRGGLQKGANLMPLDSAPVAVRGHGDVAPAGSGPGRHTVATVDESSGIDQEPQPLLASIAPFAAMRADGSMSAPAAATSAAPAPDAVSGDSISIHLDHPSWVQVTNGQGKRLEYALLPAGTDKTYDTTQAGNLNVRIGNADAATVVVGGKKVDLDRYQHANVAHFSVDVRSGKTTPTDN